MTKKNQIGNLTNEIFTGNSGAIWINEIYGDPKNLKGNAVGGNDIINGGNDGATNHLYGDAYGMEGNAKGGVDTITGGSNGATNYIYGDAYSMERNTKGGVDTITGGANGATNYIYGDAYRMKGNVQGGNDILIGGLNTKNFIYGDAFAITNGAKAGDDAISLANASSLVLNKVVVFIADGSTKDFSPPITSSTIQNNALIGDADNILKSSSGADSINIGNNSSIDIDEVSLYSLFGSNINILSTVGLDISKNSLIGDAKILKNSSSGNDNVAVGLNIINNVDKKNFTTSNNSIVSDRLTVDINLSSNRLIGDAESMKKSSGGHDIIQLGNNFKNKLGDAISDSYIASSLQSSSITKFSLSDNAIYGDAKAMDHASGGDDQIIVGNSIRSEIRNIRNFVRDNSFLSVKKESNFSLLNNTLIGDAKTMSHSQGGNDVISLGNDFVNSVGTLNSGVYINSTDTTTVLINYTIDNNNLYGDAETMSYCKGGNDTLSIGVGIVGDSHLALDIKNNTLYGDANTMKRSQGGDDKLTGADGEGSVTYLYGDAKFTDGKSGAGNDTLISGHGNDHMWGDFGSYSHRVDLHDDEEDDDRNERHSGHDDDHHDSEYEDDSPAIYVNYSTGKDIFVFGENNGNDIIYDFQRGLDKIDLRSLGGIDGIDDFTITSSLTQSSDRVIDFGNGNSITLIGVSELSANDFMFAAVV